MLVATRIARPALQSVALYIAITTISMMATVKPAHAVDPPTVPPTSGTLTYYGAADGYLCYFPGVPVGSGEEAVAWARARQNGYSTVGFAKTGSGTYDGKRYSSYRDSIWAYPYQATLVVTQYVCPDGSRNASPYAYNCGGMPNARNNPNECCPCGYVYVSGQALCVLQSPKPADCPASCPAGMSGSPCACNPDYVPDPNGPGCVYQTLTLTIETDYSAKGPFTTEPGSILALKAVVKDQFGLPKAGKQVTLTVDVQGGSGGHDHNEKRPKGDVGCAQLFGTCQLGATDGSGEAGFTFRSPAPSGIHTITATCPGCNAAYATVNVKVDGLRPIPGSPLYALEDSAGKVIGAIKNKHTANHYLTEAAIDKLEDLAIIYTKLNPGAKLYLNDASLVWGGLFDVGSSTPWSSPHSLHDRGVSLDIRAANSGPNNEGAVPVTVFREFIKEARREKFNIGLHCKNSSDTNYCLGQPNNRHFHVDF